MDASDLVPAAQVAAAMAARSTATGRARGDLGAMLFAANSGYRDRMVPNAGRAARLFPAAAHPPGPRIHRQP